MGRKTNAIQFDRVVAMQGGPDTVWARRVRQSLADERDPYRQQHAADNRARALAGQKRHHALTALYRKRVAGRTAAQRKALTREYERHAEKIIEELRPRAFVEWAAANKRTIEDRERVIERTRVTRIEREMRSNKRERKIEWGF